MIEEKTMKQLRDQVPEDGFALPIAIGVGLIMLLLGVTMIVRSQNDQVNASAQKATAKSLAAAEAGISKVQAFLDRNRVLAMYPDTGSESWRSRSTLNICPGDVSNAEIDALFPDGGGDWPNVDPTDTTAQPLNGEFRVVSYAYATPGQPDDRGVLRVQGRVNAGEPGESVSQIEVGIPVQSANTRNVALWVKGSVTGSPTVNGAVVGDCRQTLDISPVTNIVQVDQTLRDQELPTSTPIPSPPPPAAPADSVATPLGRQIPEQDKKYPYTIPDLNRSLRIWSGSVVELWVSGDIDLRGQTVECVQLSGNPCSPNDAFRLTVYASGSSTIRLDQSSVLCNVHFHAPDYSVEFSTSGTPAGDCGTPNSQLTGAFWIDSWSGSTGTVTLNAMNSGPEIPAVLPPQLDAIAQWKNQKVD